MKIARWIGWSALLAGLLASCTPTTNGPNLPTCSTTADCKPGDDCVAGYCAPNSSCQVHDKQFCYPGPAGTENVGVCATGHKTCDNGEWTECKDAVVPTDEICGDGKDNDCDGKTDEGC